MTSLDFDVIEPLEQEICESEEMALTNPDKEWIKKEIHDAVHGTGWHRFVVVARDWSLPGIAMALLAIAVAILIFAMPEWKQYTEFRVRSEDRLQLIEARLLNLAPGSSPHDTLKELGTLQPKALAQALPALRAVSHKTIPANTVEPATIRRISENLAKVGDSMPDYWQASLEFVHFASSSLSPPGEVPPAGPPWQMQLNGTNGTVAGGLFKRKAFLVTGSYTFENVEFVNCRIAFGPEAKVIWRKVVFVNCIFDFPAVYSEPTPAIKNAVKALLASGIERAVIGG